MASLQNSAARVATRYLRAAVQQPWDNKKLLSALAVPPKVVREQVPGVRWDYKTQGTPSYPWGTPDPSGYIRFQVPHSSIFAGFWPVVEIPFQAVWDEPRKMFMVTSFLEKGVFRTKEKLWEFLEDAPKVGAFIRKGLKTVDAGQAAFFAGKLTPDSVVDRVLSVDVSFSTTDEWHYTNLTIELLLRTAKPVPEKLIEIWLENHWHEVQKLSTDKTPPPAGPPSRYARWEDDDGDDEEDDGDWKMDQPEEGLGWVNPRYMSFEDAEHMTVRQTGNKATVHASGSTR